MKKLKKLFGGINITWPKLIIFAIIAGAYTAFMAILPIAKYTSFADIAISLEVWILFGIIIIMNSKSALDSATKCFVFFLISQPLVYLLRVPFYKRGFEIFHYYPAWFICTLLTIPMGFIGYFLKKDKWWGILILFPILLVLGGHYIMYLTETVSFFPYHLISATFCLLSLLAYPWFIFKNQKLKFASMAISILIIIAGSTFVAVKGRVYYNAIIMYSGGSEGMTFDDTYKVYFKDKTYGNVYIVYNAQLKEYVVDADFAKIGKTELTIESPEGDKTAFDIDIKRDTYNLTKKQQP